MGHVHLFKLKDAHQRTRVHETTNKLVVQNTNSYLSIYACFRMRPSPCHRCRLGRKRPQPLGAKIPLKRKTVVLIALILFQFVVFFLLPLPSRITYYVIQLCLYLEDMQRSEVSTKRVPPKDRPQTFNNHVNIQ